MKSKRIVAFLLCVLTIVGVMPFGTALAAESTVTIESQTNSAFDYLEYYKDGTWHDLNTPRHWIESTGQICYCVEHSEGNPHGATYTAASPSSVFSASTLAGMQSILMYGYPCNTPSGFTADEARQATANALRFWLSENGEAGSYSFTNRKANPNYIRAKSGYEHVLAWADELLSYARAHKTLTHSITFTPSSLTLASSGNSFVGQTQVKLTNINSGYTLNSSNLPSGVSISGYTGSANDTLTITAPESAMGQSFTITATGKDTRSLNNITAYVPSDGNLQKIFLCATTAQVVSTASIGVDTPAYGYLKIAKTGENGAALAGVKFGVYSDAGCTQKLCELTTGSDGTVTSGTLPAGTVYVKELSTVRPYVIDSAAKTVTISINKITTLNVENITAKGQICINKTAEQMEERKQTMPEQKFDREAWAAQKKERRDALYAMADEMADAALRDASALADYLGVQARLGKTSVTNSLLVAAQKPEASFLRSFEDWQKHGRSVMKGEKGIDIIALRGEYKRTDGSTAMNFDVKRVFDVSQTQGNREWSRKVPTVNIGLQHPTRVLFIYQAEGGENLGSGNWIIDNLMNALQVWNDKLAEIWLLITQSPQEFKGGGIWDVIVSINGSLKAVGYALLVLFFLVGVVKTCGSFTEIKKPEHALRLFVRFAVAKGVVGYGLDLMMALFRVVQGIVSRTMDTANLGSIAVTTLPDGMSEAIQDLTFFQSIPAWAVSLIGSLVIFVLSFIMIMSVYGRFFKLYLYTAIAPIPLSTFAGEPTSNIGKSFLKSYAAVCLEGAIIVLGCIIFSIFAASPPVVDTGASAVTIVWTYMGELIFNLLVLTGAIKMADRVVREMFGL